MFRKLPNVGPITSLVMRQGHRLVLVVGLALLAIVAGCADPAGRPDSTDGDEADPNPGNGSDGGEAQPRTTIDWNRVPADDELPDPDPARLGELVDRQVYENGTGEPRYRTPGTAGHEAAVPVLASMLANASDRVERQTFDVELPCLGEVNATNLYGVREGTAEREIWLAAHWDSRAWADQASAEDRREEPVLGANDGAAAVAVATHALELLPATNATVKVALFDVEDQGSSGPAMPCEPTSSSMEPYNGWIQGSTYAAGQLDETERDRIQALILVDMPGHEELSLLREGRSNGHAPELTELAFGVAERFEASSFRNETGPGVLDDHVPFLEREVPALDLIHLDSNGTTSFPWTWHTPHDTPEHVSEDSMAEVTRVVAGTALAVDRGALPPGEG